MANIEHPIRCRCGTLQGVVLNPSTVNRVICYCKDCQAFARFLGSPETILDQDGGTDIVQVRQDAVAFSEGIDHLACIQLTAKGLCRWYASCCQSAIGNTPRGKNPAFVGLIHDCLGDRPLDKSFGPVTCRVYTKSSSSQDLKDKGNSGMISAVLKLSVIAMTGMVSKVDTPFFTADGRPVSKPRLLSAEELKRVRDSV